MEFTEEKVLKKGVRLAKLSVDKALLKAKSHTKKGEIEYAKKLYQAVLQAFPKNKRAQQGLAALNIPEQPKDTQSQPQDAINQLIQLYNQGHLATVVERAQTLTEQYPEAFIIWNVLGAANKRLGRVQAASEAFKKVTELNPAYADGFNNLGVTLQEQGKLEEAIASLYKALSLKPDYADAYNNMGNALKDQGKLEEAIASFNKALSLKPDYTVAYYNMGNALKDQGKLEEAIASFNKALSLKPDYAVAYNNMGNALENQGKLKEAIEAYNKALSIKPDFADAYLNLGNALQVQGKLEEAIASFNKALSLKPDYAGAYNNVGNALKDQGKLEEAITSFNKALSLKPDYAEVHKNLSSLIKYRPNDTQVTLVSEMIQRPDLKDNDRCYLHYTFAKMNEDLGDLDAAYNHYVAGGKLRQKLLSYDFKQDELIFNQVKNIAPKLKEFAFDKHIEAAINTPIFILGMPRSGTTLVEQIISSHSQVHGAGELPFLCSFISTFNNGIQTINSDNLLRIRNAYLHELEKISNGCRFVTDKTPHNFLRIGFLLKALPEAKVIHVQRDPAATCWSNFKHYFSTKGLGYSYDLKDTVGYFKLYQDLMDFWDQQYSDQIYHLDYDKLTLKQESETRRLIQYIGLDWEYKCLSPQDNKRSVRTASQQQVREKIYTGSSQAWRKFELFLNGIFDGLEA